MMNIVSIFATLFIYWLNRFCCCEPIYSPCYKDWCLRGLQGSEDTQYCNEKDERCFFCKDKATECGNGTMPRDCDGYCMGIALRRVQNDLKATNNKNIQLEGSILHVNKSLADTLVKLKKLITENNDLELTLNTTNENTQTLQKNFSELYKEKTKVESDMQACNGKTFYWIVAVVLLSAGCAGVFIYIIVQDCRRRRLHIRGKQYSNVPDETEEPAAMIGRSRGEGSTKLMKADSEDSAVNLSGDHSRDNTPDASDAECEETTVIVKSPIVITQGKPTVAFKRNDAKSRTEPTGVDAQGVWSMGSIRLDDGIGNVDSENEDNCLKKITPDALKGIQPTPSSTGQHCVQICS